MVTKVAMAAIAHPGWIRPVLAAGTPMPLNRKAMARFCLVRRQEPLANLPDVDDRREALTHEV